MTLCSLYIFIYCPVPRRGNFPQWCGPAPFNPQLHAIRRTSEFSLIFTCCFQQCELQPPICALFLQHLGAVRTAYTPILRTYCLYTTPAATYLPTYYIYTYTAYMVLRIYSECTIVSAQIQPAYHRYTAHFTTIYIYIYIHRRSVFGRLSIFSLEPHWD